VLSHVQVDKPWLVWKCLGPEEVLLAASAIHVVAATILFDLAEAVRAKFHKLRVLLSPSIVLLSSKFLKANSAFLSHNSSSELFLATVRIHTKAIILDEVAATEGAWGELAVDLKASEGLIKSKSIKLIPGVLIHERLDLLVVDYLVAGEVRALHSNKVMDSHDKGNVISGYSGYLVVKSRGLINLNSKVGSDTASAETMSTIKLGRIAIEFGEANAAFIFGAARRSEGGEVEG